MQRVHIERKEHAERDEEQLGCFVDTEPQDHQGDQREMGNVADHLQRAVEQCLAEPRQAIGDAQDQSDATADCEADEGPPRADADMGPQFT
jgi:hypothetical protein